MHSGSISCRAGVCSALHLSKPSRTGLIIQGRSMGPPTAVICFPSTQAWGPACPWSRRVRLSHVRAAEYTAGVDVPPHVPKLVRRVSSSVGACGPGRGAWDSRQPLRLRCVAGVSHTDKVADTAGLSCVSDETLSRTLLVAFTSLAGSGDACCI